MDEKISSPNLVDSIDKFLKFVSACGAAAAIVGFCALWSQFSAMNVPLSLLTLPEAARAGLLPTIVLAMGASLAFAGHRYKEDKSALTALSYVMLAVAWLAAALLILPGLLIGMPWLLHFPVDGVAPLVMNNWSPTNGLVASVVLWALTLAIGFVGKHAKLAFFTVEEPRAESAPTNDPLAVDELTPTSASTTTEQRGIGEILFIAAIATFSIFFYSAISLAGLRWFAEILRVDFPLVSNLVDAEIWRISLILAILVCAVGGIAALIIDARDARRVAIWSYVAAAAIVVTFFVIYVRIAYPLLPSALGGGRPEVLTIWLDGDELPPDSVPVAGNGQCKEANKLIRCDEVTVLQIGDHLIFPGQKSGEIALVVKASAIKALMQRAPLR